MSRSFLPLILSTNVTQAAAPRSRSRDYFVGERERRYCRAASYSRTVPIGRTLPSVQMRRLAEDDLVQLLCSYLSVVDSDGSPDDDRTVAFGGSGRARTRSRHSGTGRKPPAQRSI